MELIKTKTGLMMVFRNEKGRITKVYAGPIVKEIQRRMFNRLNLN